MRYITRTTAVSVGVKGSPKFQADESSLPPLMGEWERNVMKVLREMVEHEERSRARASTKMEVRDFKKAM